MRREERVTVQGPVKEQQPDRMSHRGATQGKGWHAPFPKRYAALPDHHKYLTKTPKTPKTRHGGGGACVSGPTPPPLPTAVAVRN